MTPDPIPVVIYARSSKDLHDISCEVQVDRLRQYIAREGPNEVVVGVYQDRGQSSTRDLCPEFVRMQADAKAEPPPFRKVYCTDTSRFGRDGYLVAMAKRFFRKKRGIEVVFESLPRSGSYMDEPMERVVEAFDSMHSAMAREKGLDGMRKTVEQGFRAGGRAPYGYIRSSVGAGSRADGSRLTKTVLIADPDTSEYAREYISRRAAGESRSAVLKDFNDRRIPRPGKAPVWRSSTGKAIEDNILTYAGHTVWNRHNEKVTKGGAYVGGTKLRPRSEWIINENTHPALATPDEVAAIEEQSARRRRTGQWTRKQPPTYLLTGVVACGVCEAPMYGDRGYYVCRDCKARSGGNGSASARQLDGLVIGYLRDHLFADPGLVAWVAGYNAWVEDAQQARLGAGDEPRQRRLGEIDVEQRRLLKAHMKGLVPEEVFDLEAGKLRDEQLALRAMVHACDEVDSLRPLTVEEVRPHWQELRDRLSADFDSFPLEQRRSLVATSIERLRLFPKEKVPGQPWQRRVEVLSRVPHLSGFKKASPTGFEPVLLA